MNQAMQVLTSQATNEWYTPAWIIALAKRVMGGIDLDPASCAEANATVGATHYYSAEEDGYWKQWRGRVWLNPPFSDTPRWVRRLGASYDDGDVQQAILLVNSAPGYNWWEEMYRTYPVCLLRERVAFVSATGVQGGTAKKGTTIAYLGGKVCEFSTAFGGYGRILLPA